MELTQKLTRRSVRRGERARRSRANPTLEGRQNKDKSAEDEMSPLPLRRRWPQRPYRCPASRPRAGGSLPGRAEEPEL